MADGECCNISRVDYKSLLVNAQMAYLPNIVNMLWSPLRLMDRLDSLKLV